eukprot:RCo000169
MVIWPASESLSKDAVGIMMSLPIGSVTEYSPPSLRKSVNRRGVRRTVDPGWASPAALAVAAAAAAALGLRALPLCGSGSGSTIVAIWGIGRRRSEGEGELPPRTREPSQRSSTPHFPRLDHKQTPQTEHDFNEKM